MLWIFSEYQSLSLNFFETKLLAFDWFADFFPISKNKQNVSLELLNLVIQAKSKSLSQALKVLFLENNKNCELITKHLSANFVIPFTKIVNDSIQNKLINSRNPTSVMRFARETQLYFDYFYSISNDKLYSKEIAGFVKILSSDKSLESVQLTQKAKTQLFERLEYLLDNSKVFGIANLFEFARMLFGESISVRSDKNDYVCKSYEPSFLDEIFEFCFGRLGKFESSKMAVGLAKEIFDFISLIARGQDYSK